MELLCKTGFESPGHNTKLSGRLWEFHQIDYSNAITTSASVEHSGISVNIPAGAYFSITAIAFNNHSEPEWVGIGDSDNPESCSVSANAGIYHASCTYSRHATNNELFHIWVKYKNVGLSSIFVKGFYILGANE